MTSPPRPSLGLLRRAGGGYIDIALSVIFMGGAFSPPPPPLPPLSATFGPATLFFSPQMTTDMTRAPSSRVCSRA